MEPTPNQIPSFGYTAGTMDLGKSFASGLQVGSELGKGIGEGISGALNVATQNRTADDMLQAMNKTGMLSNDAYQAVAGKSLGAKQSMLGMYATQWINQQAQTRELQKIGYTGAVDVAAKQQEAHNQFLEAYQAIKSGYPAAAGVNTKNILAQPGAQAGGQPPQPGQVAPMVGPSGPLALPAGVTPQISQQAQQLSGTATAPSAMGSGNIYSPGPKLGTTIARSDKQPFGSTLVQGTGPKGEVQHFVKLPDGTLRPIQG